MFIEDLDMTVERITYTRGVTSSFKDLGRLILGELVSPYFKGGVRVNTRNRPVVGEWPNARTRPTHWGGVELILPPYHGVVGITIPQEFLDSGEITWSAEGAQSMLLDSRRETPYLLDSHPDHALLAIWRRLPLVVEINRASTQQLYRVELGEEDTRWTGFPSLTEFP